MAAPESDLRTRLAALVTEYRASASPAPYTSERALIERLESILDDPALLAATETTPSEDLLEKGRRLASWREDLIARGVDPRDLLVPISPSALAREATIGDTGICRTCTTAITYETVEEHGYLPRTGWTDGARVDPLVCSKAIHFRHVPLVGRERAIWDAATKAAAGDAGD